MCGPKDQALHIRQMMKLKIDLSNSLRQMSYDRILTLFQRNGYSAMSLTVSHQSEQVIDLFGMLWLLIARY
jgi:hypothetical protein